MIHIYTAGLQPATRYRIPDMAHWFRNPRNRLLWTHCCGKRRPAKNLQLQAFYDCVHAFCRPGKGCKGGK